MRVGVYIIACGKGDSTIYVDHPCVVVAERTLEERNGKFPTHPMNPWRVDAFVTASWACLTRGIVNYIYETSSAWGKRRPFEGIVERLLEKLPDKAFVAPWSASRAQQ